MVEDSLSCRNASWAIGTEYIILCDWIRENPLYGINPQSVQCAFLVPDVEKLSNNGFLSVTSSYRGQILK